MHVLVVDDNALNLKLVRAVLEGAGHTVLPAADGIEALEALGRESVDAVISDILMPRMDGYRLCHEVRHSDCWRVLPFIFYTNTYLSASDERLAADLGADRYVCKPATATDLLAVLNEVARSDRRRSSGGATAEVAVLKEYSEGMVRKLEERNLELEQARADLQRAMMTCA